MLTITKPCLSECESVSHGSRAAFPSNVPSLEVSVELLTQSLPLIPHFSRDPTKHSTLKEEIEEQSTALYATARLWDDGIIKPVDTRDTVGLALALSARERGSPRGSGSGLTTWDGDRKGFGVFRM